MLIGLAAKNAILIVECAKAKHEEGASLEEGAMVGGAVLGWLRSRSPLWGSVAAPAGDALGALGIGLFIAAVAIGAGGTFIKVRNNFV